MVIETDPGAGLDSKLNFPVYYYTDNLNEANVFHARDKMYHDVPNLDESKCIGRDSPSQSDYTKLNPKICEKQLGDFNKDLEASP